MSKVCLRKTLRAGVGIVKGWSNVGRMCDMDTERASAELRIGELSRRVGVSEYVLRAWESRYGLLKPARSPGGYRLYSEDDQSRVRRMQAHLADGLAAAQAARAAIADEPAGRQVPEQSWSTPPTPSDGPWTRWTNRAPRPCWTGCSRTSPWRVSCGTCCCRICTSSVSGGSTERSVLARNTSPVTWSEVEWRAWLADGETAVDHAPFWPARPESCMRWPCWPSGSCSTGTGGGSGISERTPRCWT